MAIRAEQVFEFMTGFEVEDGAGATSLAHILTQNSGGVTQPTRSTSSPLTGVASFDYNKAGGTAVNNADNMYEPVTARTAYSMTVQFLPTALPTTDGNGVILGAFTINYAGWGIYVVSSTPRIAILSAAPATVNWYGTTDLTNGGGYGTAYYVTFTHMILAPGSQSLGMVILRDSNGYELERSPWITMSPDPAVSTINNVVLGVSSITSSWTSAMAFKMDDLVVVAGGVHAPKWCEIVLVRPTGDGVITRWRTLTTLTGTDIDTIVAAGNLSADVGHFVYYGTAGRRITAAVFSSPNTTYTLEAPGLDADPGVGATVYVYGAGYDTDDDGVIFDEVDESPAPDGTTTIYTHFGTHVNKFMGFTHGGTGIGALTTTFPANEALLCDVWARAAWAVTVGNVSWAPAAWHSTQANVHTFETLTSTGDDPTSFFWAHGPPRQTLPGLGTAMTTAQVDAFEIGTRRLLTGTGATNEVDVTWVGMEVAKVKIWDDACHDGFSMAEPSLVHMAEITAIATNTDPAQVTTEFAHGLSTGDVVTIAGSNSGVSIDGTHTVTVTGATTFTVPVDNNPGAAGTAGRVILDHFRITAMSATNPCIVTCSGDLGTSPVEMVTAVANVSSTSTTLVDSGKTWSDDQWNGGTVMIIGGTGVGQKRTVSDTSSGTTLTVSAWTTNPDNTSVYVVGFPLESGNIRGSNSTPRIEGRHWLVRQDSGTASSSASTTDITDSGRAWATNQWAGGSVYIVSGTGSGQVRTVSSNDADSLTVSVAFSPQPDNTSVYRVQTQGNIFVTPINCTGAGTAGKMAMRKRKKNLAGPGG